MERQIRNSGPLPFLEKEGKFIKDIPINRWILLKESKKRQPSSESSVKKRTFKSHKKGDENLLHKSPKSKLDNDEDSSDNAMKDPDWASNLSSWQRLFAHHTLSSIRRTVTFVCSKAPRDKLDFVLDSTYRHEEAVFPEITDVFLQPETIGHQTWRVLRNIKDVPQPGVITRGHPIRFGGIKSRPNIYNVKLGIPAPHVAQTNSGYSRREDGALYKV
ncbi:hypothetical protein C0J52_06259 [Blattella germanica]|nr:hypothetical protein C0J52_06259 [Blattella germanica]